MGRDGLRDDDASAERFSGVVRDLRLAADDLDPGTDARRGETGTAQETASADGREQNVEVLDVFEKLESTGRLARDGPKIVIRVNRTRPRALSNGVRGRVIFLGGRDRVF